MNDTKNRIYSDSIFIGGDIITGGYIIAGSKRIIIGVRSCIDTLLRGKI